MVPRPRQPLFDRYDFGPVVDGTLLPGHPFDPAATAISADIPCWSATSRTRAAIFLAPNDKVWNRVLTEDEMRAADRAGRRRRDRPRDRALPRPLPWRQSVRPADLDPDRLELPHPLAAARRAQGAQRGAPVWMYSFDWETPVFDGKLKAYHALDVPFVFNTIDVDRRADRGPVAHELAAGCRRPGRRSRAPASRTTRRSRTGRPTRPRGARRCFSTMCRVVDDPDGEVRPLWSKVATG